MGELSEKPTFSVVIPTYNKPKDIVEALASLENQTFKDFEVIIVDDGSVKIEEVIEDYRRKSGLKIRYFRSPFSGKGAGFSFSLGILLSRGEYVVFFNDDALADSKWLEELWKVHRKGEPLVASRVIGLFQHKFDWFNKDVGYFMGPVDTLGDNKTVFPIGLGLSIKREIFEKVGLLSINLGRKTKYRTVFGEDSVWMVKASKAGFEIKSAPKAVIYHKTGLFGRSRVSSMIKYAYGMGVAYRIFLRERGDFWKEFPKNLLSIVYLPLRSLTAGTSGRLLSVCHVLFALGYIIGPETCG